MATHNTSIPDLTDPPNLIADLKGVFASIQGQTDALVRYVRMYTVHADNNGKPGSHVIGRTTNKAFAERLAAGRGEWNSGGRIEEST